MPSDLVITKETLEPALDHQQLFDIGLMHVQRLASRIWNDYNVHDPGITTLELLAYALTDLSYRASFSIKDLLASDGDNAANMRNQFFTARQILPNRPLTLLDYRKLLIDLEHVKNAWLQAANETYYVNESEGKLHRYDPTAPNDQPVRVKGLYNVVLEYMEGVGAAKKAEVEKLALECLNAHRNLCEDFVGISEVGTQAFILCAELELLPDADIDNVHAELFFQVRRYLSPPIRNYTLTEMLSRKKADGTAYSAAEIFDGPALRCGFIDDDELAGADLRTEIRLSDVISIIMDIEGVQAVRDIVINPARRTTSLENKWVVRVDPGKKAELLDERSEGGGSRIVYYKRTMPVDVNTENSRACYDKLVAEEKSKAETEAIPPYDLDIPSGTYRDLAAYYSFQNHYPALYGLSDAGLGDNATEKRRDQAYQLKAYLLFFDQIMANYMAQLSHVKDLFSTDESLRQTYFYQTVDTFANYTEVYGAGGIAAKLQELGENRESMVDRRRRFLDHLIARFAENFSGYANIMYAAFKSGQADLIDERCEFINNYPQISSERALAYNYTLKKDKDLWNSENISGLERRLARLLGIRNFSRRNLSEVAYDVYAEIDGNPSDEFRFRIRNRKTGEIVLSSSTKYATPDLARKEMREAIRLASMQSGYERKTTIHGKHYFNIIDATGEVVARRIEYFDTEENMNAAINDLIGYLREHYSDEGMYLIENILLRPKGIDDPFLPICLDPNCKDCGEADPYSYRIHIILPAYGSRLSKVEFRRYVEDVIRSETPAHILPKICWINADEMSRLEKAYRDWIYLKAGAETTDRIQKLSAFAKILFEVRSVHPAGWLRECGGGTVEEKFIVGQSSLGTMTGDDA